MIPESVLSCAYSGGNSESANAHKKKEVWYKFLPKVAGKIDKVWVEKSLPDLYVMWPELAYPEDVDTMVIRLKHMHATVKSFLHQYLLLEMFYVAQSEGLVEKGTGASLKDIHTMHTAALEWQKGEKLTDEWLEKNVGVLKVVLKSTRWVEDAYDEVKKKYQITLVKKGRESKHFVYDIAQNEFNDCANQRFRRFMLRYKSAIWYERSIDNPPVVPGKMHVWSEKIVHGIKGHLATYVEVAKAAPAPRDFSHPISKAVNSGWTKEQILEIVEIQLDKEISRARVLLDKEISSARENKKVIFVNIICLSLHLR